MDFLKSIAQKIHEQKKKLLLVCPVCKARFAEKIELVVHVQSRH
jgi:hypothetical protein